MVTPPLGAWHPVLPGYALRVGDNIVSALVQGQELALWRSLDGATQAWDNRCPHRGVRLTLGRILDGRLSCAYHGWEYAAGTGRCEHIPAMPELAVPGRVCVRTFPVVEIGAMVWTRIDGGAAEGSPFPASPSPVAPISTSHTFFLRTLAIRASLHQVHAHLGQAAFQPSAPSVWRGTLAELEVTAFTLEAEPGLSLVHLWCGSTPCATALQAVFAAARRMRSAIESRP
jgi:nitrite reductase/ring-hydroxylating ferredoxin subunit